MKNINRRKRERERERETVSSLSAYISAKGKKAREKKCLMQDICLHLVNQNKKRKTEKKEASSRIDVMEKSEGKNRRNNLSTYLHLNFA